MAQGKVSYTLQDFVIFSGQSIWILAVQTVPQNRERLTELQFRTLSFEAGHSSPFRSEKEARFLIARSIRCSGLVRPNLFLSNYTQLSLYIDFDNRLYPDPPFHPRSISANLLAPTFLSQFLCRFLFSGIHSMFLSDAPFVSTLACSFKGKRVVGFSVA